MTQTIGKSPVVRGKVCQRPGVTSHSPVNGWFCVTHENEKVMASEREIACTSRNLTAIKK